MGLRRWVESARRPPVHRGLRRDESDRLGGRLLPADPAVERPLPGHLFGERPSARHRVVDRCGRYRALQHLVCHPERLRERLLSVVRGNGRGLSGRPYEWHVGHRGCAGQHPDRLHSKLDPHDLPGRVHRKRPSVGNALAGHPQSDDLLLQRPDDLLRGAQRNVRLLGRERERVPREPPVRPAYRPRRTLRLDRDLHLDRHADVHARLL